MKYMKSTDDVTKQGSSAKEAKFKGGVIVNVGSSSAHGGRIDQGAYAASKAAIQLLTETLSLEGKAQGIHAYCVVPRRTATGMRKSIFPDEEKRNLLEPEQVARTILDVIFEANPCLSGMVYNIR